MSAALTEMNQIAATGLAALLNTLWCAGAMVALTWVGLHFWPRVNAATRYWVWTAVLISLLALPFIPGLVKQARAGLPHPKAISASQPLATVSAPMARIRELAPVTVTVNTAAGSNSWPLWLLAVWIIAAAWQLTRLARGISAVRNLKARATCSHGTSCVSWAFPFPRDKPTTRRWLTQTVVFDGLRFQGGKRQNNSRLRRAVQVLASGEIASPVAVGFVHPAVVIPPRLLERLEEGKRQDVLLHELAHLARYDDWMALATHALGALLILHPLAAIVLRRIEREREMACDDFVVARTGSARSYARSLARLHDLRWSAGTRLLAPGILGGKPSLADRIESLLQRGRQFSARPSLARLGVSAILLSALLGAGGLVPDWIAIGRAKPGAVQATAPLSQDTAMVNAKFEVASIKPHKSSERRKDQAFFSIVARANDGRFYATGATLRMLIRLAYDVQDSQIVGGPGWINHDRFDIQAKADSSVDAELRKLSPDQGRLIKRRMLQALLTDRFKLTLHREPRDMPIYALVVAKNGPRLQESKAGNAAPQRPGSIKAGTVGGPMIRVRFGGAEQEITSHGTPMTFLAQVLSQPLGRTVIDKTGLSGRYDFTLKWTPDIGRGRMVGGPGPIGGPGEGSEPQIATGMPAAPGSTGSSSDSSGPSIFTAVQQQLGLRLKPEKGPVEVLVIDHVEQPTPN